MDRARVLLQVALGNLAAHKIRNAIVGSIMIFGTALVVVGLALLGSVEASMSESIIATLAGHIQVQQAGARDDLAIFGDTSMGQPDIGEIEDFAAVRDVLMGVDNVRVVIPMGTNMGSVRTGNDMDETLRALRTAIAGGDDGAVAQGVDRVRRIARLLVPDYTNRKKLSARTDEIDEALAMLARADSDELAERLAADPEATLQWLDVHVAKLAGEGGNKYFRYLGTDIDLFAQSFERFKIVEGDVIPMGRRGVLLNRKSREKYLKAKVARLIDELHEGTAVKGGTIAGDAALEAKARQLANQLGAIELDLDPTEAVALEGELRVALGEAAAGKDSLPALLVEALTVDDADFEAKRGVFYDVIAPYIEVYPFGVGDTITLSATTKRGYIRSVNLKVYGIFSFEGLEGSELSGAVNLLDLPSFRELHGRMDADQRAELSAIQDDVGAEFVAREEAEDALFGGGDAVVAEQGAEGFDDAALFAGSGGLEADEALFTQEDVDHGLVLHAAIFLDDPSRLEETRLAIEAAAEAAGIPLRAIDWNAAAGITGQFVTVVRVVLYLAIFIIFSVALIIINNSMVTATMKRVREIGTLRAIGAQRGFVSLMVLFETLALGLVAGALGVALGGIIVTMLGTAGITAQNDVMQFLFSGPKLFPHFEASNLIAGFWIVLLVSLVSTLYPARLATAVAPIDALRQDD